MRDTARHTRLLSSVAIVGALAALGGVALTATDASAWQSPAKKKYMTAPLQLCDEGTFYVGGAPKVTPYGLGPVPPATAPYTQIIIGAMYVRFQTPMVAKSWPL